MPFHEIDTQQGALCTQSVHDGLGRCPRSDDVNTIVLYRIKDILGNGLLSMGLIMFSTTEVRIANNQRYHTGALYVTESAIGEVISRMELAPGTMVTVNGENEFESINRGEPYPSNFDRPHVLNVIWSYHLTRRITFSSNLVYMTGRPVTFPSSLYFINDNIYIDFNAKNQIRVPDYFRIDASATLEGNLKARKRFHSTWSLNIYNVLGRKNPQSIFFEPNDQSLNGFSFSVIGVPVVTLSWNVKMGNYESN